MIISLCLTIAQDLNNLDKSSLGILAFLCNYSKGSFLLTHLSPVIGNRLLICVHAFDPSMILTLSLGVDSPNLCACFWPILTQSLGMDSPNLCACFWPILTQSLGTDSSNLCARFWPILTQSLEFYSACQTPAQSQFQSLVVTVVWHCFVHTFGYSTFGQAGPCTNLYFPPGCYIAWGKRPTLMIFFTAQLAFIKFMADLTAAHSFLILMMPFMTWWQTVHHPPNYVHKLIPIALIAILHYLTCHKEEPLNTPTHTHMCKTKHKNLRHDLSSSNRHF